ncbi:beta-hexosaminidase 1 [Oratosquilla oratoria]|uniref:beta-hexosaminidase 1 n=1 Tax=Oratosquilla oratoria TaxID=337810 RepID=UPI003F76DD7E
MGVDKARLFLAIFAVLAPAEAFDWSSSPWAWHCADGTCVKGAREHISNPTSLETCKLTCGKDGPVWPKPDYITIGKEVSYFLPKNLAHDLLCSGDSCNLLKQAFAIFEDNLNKYNPTYSNGEASWTGPWAPSVETHQVSVHIVLQMDQSHLKMDTDESYQLTVQTAAGGSTSAVTITAPTFFGARHALETLSQLIDYEESTNSLQIVNIVTIQDSPAFHYRGLLVDTSRNYVDIPTIKRTIDAMAATKLNTFHWHITDSHSFPLYLETLPKMFQYGAYTYRQVYYPADVRDIVQYARVRGVRVLPEFDAPAHVGHGWQWGEKDGLGKLVVCLDKEPWMSYCVEPPCGQLNLANENIYKVLGDIYKELVDLFSPIDLFHYGGDEVNLNCWNTSKEVTDWMEASGFGRDDDAYYKQWSVFQDKSEALLTKANKGIEVPGVIWTSHLTEEGRVGQYLDNKRYIIQIWTTGKDPLIAELVKEGFDVIMSNYDAWYLDCGFGAWVGEGNNWCSPYKGWQAVYDNSPHKIVSDLAGAQYTSQVKGGEAALWTEQADSENLDARLWPRSSALGERLWSDPDHNWRTAETRFIHHRQRLVQRGIMADRIQPQWCHQNEELCYA